MFDCTTPSYDTLYARWLSKPGELLDWAKYNPERHSLLDLCGGTGAVASDALRRGAKEVWLLDLNPRVTDKRILTIQGRAESLLGGEAVEYDPLEPDECVYPHPPYNNHTDRRGSMAWDLVVCRQAIGYLDLPKIARNLWSTVQPNGRFVFNTFVRPKFSAKVYRHQGRIYFEASGYLWNRVGHVQMTPGDLDVTAFRWWTEREIFRAFASGWALEDYKRTPATLWYSFRREPS